MYFKVPNNILCYFEKHFWKSSVIIGSFATVVVMVVVLVVVIVVWYNMIYLSTAIGLTPGGSSTVHIYTQYIEQHK